MNPYAPMLAEIVRHLDHALSLDPETDLKAILVHVRVARGYAAQATTIDNMLGGGSCEGHPMPQAGEDDT